jgi:uncharacterized protein (TIGR00299 family) protein
VTQSAKETRILFLESVAGIAGDMFAASFIDAGLVTSEELRALPKQLGLSGVKIDVTHPTKATMRTTHVNVGWQNENWKAVLGTDHEHGHGHSHSHSYGLSDSHPNTDYRSPSSSHSNVMSPKSSAHWHTHYRALDSFLERSQLEATTKSFARRVFNLIAEAEAQAHGISIEEIAFHEVGAVDSILDVVMAAHCLSKVDASRVFATPVKLGRGFIKIEHGTHPIPPPAAAKLAVGLPVAAIPAAITRENIELSTPTGLAILKALNPEFVDSIPAGVVRAQGMGAGTMDLGSYPNVFRVTLIEAAKDRAIALPYESDRIVEIVCNIDDETAERTAWLSEKLMEQGALDVWVASVTGKKGRVTQVLSVLAESSRFERLADWILRQSSTFGIRYREWDRLKLARRFEKRETERGPLTFKVGMTTDGQVLKEKPEYEELRRIWESDPGFR